MNHEMIVLKYLYKQTTDATTTNRTPDQAGLSQAEYSEALSVLIEHGYVVEASANVSLTKKGIRLAKEL